MKRVFVLAALALWLCCPSCYYDVESELYPTPPPCDLTSIRYYADIVPILNDNCNDCHSAASGNGGVVLEGYQEVLQYVDNGLLLCTVKWDPGCSEMPKNQAQMDPCTISKIEQWITDGALEN